MNYTALVQAAELATYLDDPRWVIFDCRHDLANTEAGRRAYREGHIPGARFAHLDEDLSGAKTGKNGRHPLPGAEDFSSWLGKMGVDEAKQVVAYDASGAAFASRLWWMLKWLGHVRVAVLDGGYKFWIAQKLPVTTELPKIQSTAFRPIVQNLAVDAKSVESNHDHDHCVVVEARSPERFRGQNETLDPVGGHIPGARNRFFMNNLDEQGKFKTAEILRAEFAQATGNVPAQDVVHQCGSGVTACQSLLAMEIAGLQGSRLYPGSWSEWCSDPSRPIVIG
jgi:thiosulfate/3-mercaptopyruvate sulfurtransferase